MVYLNPVGGVGNRMRAIDSAIILCEKYNRDLTVLWCKDNALSCSFNELFETPSRSNIKLTIIEYPYSFYGPDERGFKNRIKHLVNKVKISRDIAEVVKSIEALNMSSILGNDELSLLYASSKYIEAYSLNEVDAFFYKNVAAKIQSIFSQPGDVYLSSCYRLCPEVEAYRNFVPVKELNERINLMASNFSNTYGLHIRRSDNMVSSTFSTTDKFIKVIDETLISNPIANFFLATDSAETKKDLIDRYHHKILYNKVGSFDRTKSNAIKDALVDMYCLSRTKKIYGSHFSTFSQVAAAIGGVEEVTVR